MNKEMEYAYMVWLSGSFSKAAERLYMSQSALSTAVKKLEDHLGTALFDRKTQPITLTLAGEFYIQSVKKILLVQEDIDRYFVDFSGAKKTILLGSSSFFCAHVLPKLILEFQKKNQSCSVELMEANAPSLRKNLETGLVDFTLTAECFDSDVIESRVFDKDKIVLAVPVSFEVNKGLEVYSLGFGDIKSGRYLSDRFPSVSLSKFRNEPFLILKPNNEMHDRVLAMCHNHGFFPKTKLLLDQLLTAYYAANDGAGVTFIRDGILRYTAPPDKLIFYKIDDPLCVRNLYLSYRKEKVRTNIEKAFLTFLTDRNRQGSLPL